MSLDALVDLSCPHCNKRFIENAKLIRPGGNAYCPECERQFPLDETNAAIRDVLAEAKAARRRRKDRLGELKLRWDHVPAPQPVQVPLMAMSDVLRKLDELLLQLGDDRPGDKVA
jgi:uncharacterized Zn finger protein (UPF0148 family)